MAREHPVHCQKNNGGIVFTRRNQRKNEDSGGRGKIIGGIQVRSGKSRNLLEWMSKNTGGHAFYAVSCAKKAAVRPVDLRVRS